MATNTNGRPARAFYNDVKLTRQPKGLHLIAFINPSQMCYLNSAVQLIWLTTPLRIQILSCSDELISAAILSDDELFNATVLVRAIRTVFEKAEATLRSSSDEIPTFDLQNALRAWATLKPDGERVTVRTDGDVTLPFVRILSTAQQICYREETHVTKLKEGVCTRENCERKFQRIVTTTTEVEHDVIGVIALTLPSILFPSRTLASRTPRATASISLSSISLRSAATCPAPVAPVHLLDLLRFGSIFGKTSVPDLRCGHCPCTCGLERTSPSCKCGFFLKHAFTQSKFSNRSSTTYDFTS